MTTEMYVWEWLRRYGKPVNAATVAKACRLDPKRASNNLRELWEAGKIRRTAMPHGFAHRYRYTAIPKEDWPVKVTYRPQLSHIKPELLPVVRI